MTYNPHTSSFHLPIYWDIRWGSNSSKVKAHLTTTSLTFKAYKPTHSPGVKMSLLLIIVKLLMITVHTSDTRPLLPGYKLEHMEIIFPDSEENSKTNINQHQVRGVYSCERSGKTLCENVHNYPYRTVHMLVKGNNTLDALFGVDASRDDFKRRDGINEVKFFCESEDKLIFPKIGKTKNKNWHYIVNLGRSPEGYIQGIRTETCKYLNEPCELVNSIPIGYVTNCKQKYMYRKLLSLNKEGNIVYEYFEVPSACCCSYKRNYNLLFRIDDWTSSMNRRFWFIINVKGTTEIPFFLFRFFLLYCVLLCNNALFWVIMETSILWVKSEIKLT